MKKMMIAMKPTYVITMLIEKKRRKMTTVNATISKDKTYSKLSIMSVYCLMGLKNMRFSATCKYYKIKSILLKKFEIPYKMKEKTQLRFNWIQKSDAVVEWLSLGISHYSLLEITIYSFQIIEHIVYRENFMIVKIKKNCESNKLYWYSG